MTVNLPTMPVRKYRRETTEVSGCLKYMIFGFNVLFWVSSITEYIINVYLSADQSVIGPLHFNCGCVGME